MIYHDLRSFLAHLEKIGELKRITHPVNPDLEMTEIADRVLKTGGPALQFMHPTHRNMPVLCNLFGTVKRIALAMGRDEISELRDIGKLLAFFKEPEPPKGFRDFFAQLPMWKKVLNMPVKQVRSAACQEVVLSDSEVDLSALPIMRCWPEDIAPLITWGLTITCGPYKSRQNLGIYRQQLLAKNKLIMRWLAHRGGALDYHDWCELHPKTPFPVVVALGVDPATMLAAVIPVPDTLSEYAFAGLLRGEKTKVAACLNNTLLTVPATAEIILEGHIYPGETAPEGPYGDHTGYYNEVEHFPVFTVNKITHRQDAIYHSTYTGRPPDEPSVLGAALNEIFIPILQKQFPEIRDFYLPPEGCSYRLAVVTIKKQYPGHAKRIMMAIWSFLRQFMYTKFIVVCDDDINARHWPDVIWAITTRMDPIRDTILLENTPIDYLDFASPVSGLGSKMALDATNKWPGESQREWGRPIVMDNITKSHVDEIWHKLGID